MTFLAGKGTGLGDDYTVFATVPGQGQVRTRHQGQEARPGHPGRGRDRDRRPKPDPERPQRRPPAGHRDPARTASRRAPVKGRYPSQVRSGEGSLRFLRDRVDGRLNPTRAARGRLRELPPVLHGQADRRRHGRAGRAVPEAPRAPGPRRLSAVAAGRTKRRTRSGPPSGVPGCAGRLARMARFNYGGQALIEGVLMRGHNAIAVASAAWRTNRLGVGAVEHGSSQMATRDGPARPRPRRPLRNPGHGPGWLIRSANLQVADNDGGEGELGKKSWP